MFIIGFHIELSDNNIFKEAFGSINKIVDEVMIEINSEGFKVNALDRSHIVFVSLNLEHSVFDIFECDVDEKICIDTDEFMKILKRCKKNEIINLDLIDNSLLIVFEGDVTRKFKIRLVDNEYDTPTPPSLNPPCHVEIESNLLKDSLSDMELFSDVLTYKVDEDYFICESNGEFGDSDFKYLHGGDITENVKSSFSIPKLKDIFSASGFSSIVDVYLGNDMPLILKFELETGNGGLSFLLAPRLQEEE